MRIATGAAVILCCATACTVGPDYTRPPVDTPDTFRGAEAPADATVASLADAAWWNVFGDPALQDLIRTALAQNDDVRIAAARVEQAEAVLGVSRADGRPMGSVGAGVDGQRVTTTNPPRNAAMAVVQGSVAWELDFWGRYRRATQAARAQLTASEWGRRAVIASLVSRVADAYFTLGVLDLELDVSRRTLGSREESLRLTQVREQGGVTTLVDVRQAEQLVHGARAEIVSLEQQIAMQENYLSVLLGQHPGAITRGLAIGDQPHPPTVPTGVPSALLQRRPDIQQAEQVLVASNAGIGVARAAYFPSIALTGTGGVQSAALNALVDGPLSIWSAAAHLVQPVVTAGRTRSQVALAEARQAEATALYQQTIRQAFREASDALIGYRKRREYREQQTLLVRAAEEARRLAEIRYEGGAAGYLDVLDADTRRFAAELGLAEAEGQELTALVEVYRALGGGWGDVSMPSPPAE